MLADIATAGLRDPSHFAKHAAHVGHVAGADRMDDEVVAGGGQHREIVHRALEDLHVDPPLAGHLPVEVEHGRREIDDGDARTRSRIERAMLAATRGQAEHLQSVEPVGQPTAARRSAAAQPRAGIGKRRIHGRPCERRQASSEPVPRAGIVGQHSVATAVVVPQHHDDGRNSPRRCMTSSGGPGFHVFFFGS